MKEQFVTYKIALKLKELGFDEECLVFWFKKEQKLSIENEYYNILMCQKNKNSDFNINSNYISAPLWQQVIDWLGEEYDTHIVITVNPYSEIENINGYKIYQSENSVLKCVANNETQSWDYYYAREQAILKAIELCQKEK